jgi:hypothetical protein
LSKILFFFKQPRWLRKKFWELFLLPSVTRLTKLFILILTTERNLTNILFVPVFHFSLKVVNLVFLPALSVSAVDGCVDLQKVEDFWVTVGEGKGTDEATATAEDGEAK